jgi:aspartate aminotransferase-like enzyme
MDDIHDELVKAYLEYFKANEKFERTPSVRKYYAVQQQVKNIKKLIRQREKEIRERYLEAKKERGIKK